MTPADGTAEPAAPDDAGAAVPGVLPDGAVVAVSGSLLAFIDVVLVGVVLVGVVLVGVVLGGVVLRGVVLRGVMVGGVMVGGVELPAAPRALLAGVTVVSVAGAVVVADTAPDPPVHALTITTAAMTAPIRTVLEMDMKNFPIAVGCT